jgi:hypothetical protein
MPEQSQVEGNLFREMDSREPGGGMYSHNVMESLGLANAATKNAGVAGGVDTRDINRTVQGLEELGPANMDQLQQMAHGIAGKVNSTIDPRYSFALRPEVSTENNPSALDQAMQGLQTAIAIAGLIVAMN